MDLSHSAMNNYVSMEQASAVIKLKIGIIERSKCNVTPDELIEDLEMFKIEYLKHTN